MEERIAKEKLNIILLVDSSKSMQGRRIAQVDQAVKDIKDYLIDLQSENANVDFFLTIISFNNVASFYEGKASVNIDDFDYHGIKCGGYSNLHCAYEQLADILKKESKGGIMPDFGGAAPILLLLTDGHPTGNKHVDAFRLLEGLPWFKAALRYGVAIELDDARTTKVLRQFVGNNGDVIACYDAGVLKNIIKIIVVTASKVQSSNTKVRNVGVECDSFTRNAEVQQLIAEALEDAEEWEW